MLQAQLCAGSRQTGAEGQHIQITQSALNLQYSRSGAHLAQHELESVTTVMATITFVTTGAMIEKRQPYQALCKRIHIVSPHTSMLLPGQSAQLIDAEADGLVWADSQQEALLQPELVNHLLCRLVSNLKVKWSCQPTPELVS